MGLTIGTDTHPRGIFVRVADKGLMLDATSRTSTFGELNAETRSAQRSEEEGVGADLAGKVGHALRVRSLRGSG
jgi:predicted aconitase with swiveling domain